LYKAGVSLSVNTDAPTIVDITLTTEYEKLQQAFSWTIEDFYKCNVYALKAAFIPEELKLVLLEKLKRGYLV
jgi:adenosine deaminase